MEKRTDRITEVSRLSEINPIPQHYTYTRESVWLILAVWHTTHMFEPSPGAVWNMCFMMMDELARLKVVKGSNMWDILHWSQSLDSFLNILLSWTKNKKNKYTHFWIDHTQSVYITIQFIADI